MLAADATRAEVLSNLKLILLGGMQEPGHALGICVWALLTHPETMARVRADRGLLRPAVEEALRWHSPVGTQTRQVTQPVTLSGVELEPGDALAAVLASANRDERHWPDADRYDIDRRGAHAAFGLGAHHCAGAPLARHEVRLPLEMLLDRFPALRLDADYEVELSRAGSSARRRRSTSGATDAGVGRRGRRRRPRRGRRWSSSAIPQDPVAVARAGGRLYAFDDTCTHEECPLSDGVLTDGEVECPCHGSIFNLRTGEALTGPALESVRTHRVRVEDGRVQVLIDR